MNVRLALNENVIQWRLAGRLFLFCKFLVLASQVSCTSFLHVCHQHNVSVAVPAVVGKLTSDYVGLHDTATVTLQCESCDNLCICIYHILLNFNYIYFLKYFYKL